MVEDNPRDVGHEMDNLNIVYGDESLPHLYENSRISVDQLPSQEGVSSVYLHTLWIMSEKHLFSFSCAVIINSLFAVAFPTLNNIFMPYCRDY